MRLANTRLISSFTIEPASTLPRRYAPPGAVVRNYSGGFVAVLPISNINPPPSGVHRPEAADESPTRLSERKKSSLFRMVSSYKLRSNIK